jgi:hypothetical protein
LLMDFVCTLSEPIMKMVAIIAAAKSARTIKRGSPRIGLEIRDWNIFGQWLLALRNRVEM